MPEVTSPTGVAAADDEALVALARAGNRPACEVLFQRHRGVAYRVAYRMLGHEQDALDAVQDGLVKAFIGLGEFDGRSGFRTWLVRIVSNAAIDLGRKRGRRSSLGIGQGLGYGPSAGANHSNGDARRPEPAITDDPSRGLQREDLGRSLSAALDKLSTPVRHTFVLFAEAGLSYKEIADELDLPIGTVMSRLHYARHKLQGILEMEGVEGS